MGLEMRRPDRGRKRLWPEILMTMLWSRRSRERREGEKLVVVIMMFCVCSTGSQRALNKTPGPGSIPKMIEKSLRMTVPQQQPIYTEKSK